MRWFSARLVSLYLGVASCVAVGATLRFWTGNTGMNIEEMKAGDYNPYKDFNGWVNNLLFELLGLSWLQSYIVASVGNAEYAYYLQCYLRDLIGGHCVYWGTAGCWHLYFYKWRGKELFTDKGRAFPSTETIQHQMKLASGSLFVYAALPVLSEFLIEGGYTKVYFFVEEVGWPMYCAMLFAYLTLVEIGIYWMHRTLHTNKFLYNHIHQPHHKYDKADTLTPWASIAFHPLDGILQASPYVVGLFIVPVHYFTHVFLLFFSGMWATNIHDSMWGDFEPIMGSKYHTIHHTKFIYNYGQWFTFCDDYWGTLHVPQKKKIN